MKSLSPNATPSADINADMLPVQRLLRWEKERPRKVFLTQPMGNGAVLEMTWGQASHEVRRMAAYLQEQNWPEGSRIAIYGKNSAHWILADLAIWMAGHVSVPIYATFNASALNFILKHAEVRACFVGKLDDTRALLGGMPGYIPVISMSEAPALASEISNDFAMTLPEGPASQMHTNSWNSIVARTEPLRRPAPPAGDGLATIIYTSGTTGEPKGVMHTFNSFAWSLQAAAKRVSLSEKDRFMSYLPLAHVAERILVEHGALYFGAQIFFAESIDTFIEDMQRARPTIFFSVPRLWVKFQQGVHSKMPAAKLQKLLKIPVVGHFVRKKVLKGLGLDKCHLAAGGAAPMPAQVLRWYRQLGLDLIEVYGMTENCGISHSTMPGRLPDTPDVGTVGLPYAGVEQRIDSETGEIQVRSPGVMQGYYKDVQRTEEALLPDGWLRTGDKGELDANGVLRVTGRIKDIFKTSKGKYIAPAAIEDRLIQHPAIEACVVTGANLDQPLALVMLNADACLAATSSDSERADLTTDLSAHLQAINAQLAPHEKLSLLAVVTKAWTPDNGMVTPTFKVKRDQVELVYGSSFNTWVDGDLPVIWADLSKQ